MTRIIAIGDGSSPEYDGYRIKFYEAAEGRVTAAVRQAFDEGAHECLLRFHRELKIVKRKEGKLVANRIFHHELKPYLDLYVDQKEDEQRIVTPLL